MQLCSYAALPCATCRLRNRIGESFAALAAAIQQDEFFLVRAQHDFDFETVRQTAAFERWAATFEQTR